MEQNINPTLEVTTRGPEGASTQHILGHASENHAVGLDIAIRNGETVGEVRLNGRAYVPDGSATGLGRQMWVVAVCLVGFLVVAGLSLRDGTPNKTRDAVIGHLNDIKAEADLLHEEIAELHGTPNNTRDAVIGHLNQLHEEVSELATKYGTPDRTRDAIIKALANRQFTPQPRFPIGARVMSKFSEAPWEGTIVNSWPVVGGKCLAFPSHSFGYVGNLNDPSKVSYTGIVYDIKLNNPMPLAKDEALTLMSKESDPTRQGLAERLIGHKHRNKFLISENAVYGISLAEGAFLAVIPETQSP